KDTEANADPVAEKTPNEAPKSGSKKPPKAEQNREYDELIAQLISHLPSAERFEAALRKEFPGDDPERVDQAIATIREKLERAKSAFDPYGDKKQEAEEKASQIAVHAPKEKWADVRALAYFYYYVEDLRSYITEVFRTPPDDLIVVLSNLMQEILSA